MTNRTQAPFNLFSFTLLSKNASANPLVSHSCENKGLKVPCFHTLTKNIRGEGVSGPGLRAIDARHKNRYPARKKGVAQASACAPGRGSGL